MYTVFTDLQMFISTFLVNFTKCSKTSNAVLLIKSFHSYLPCIMDNAEVSFVFQLPRFLKLGVGTLLLN